MITNQLVVLAFLFLTQYIHVYIDVHVLTYIKHFGYQNEIPWTVEHIEHNNLWFLHQFLPLEAILLQKSDEKVSSSSSKTSVFVG